MLKQLLNEKLVERQNKDYISVFESKKGVNIISDVDPEIEMILPMVASSEAETNEYRFLLKQLKKRNSKAFKKIANFD